MFGNGHKIREHGEQAEAVVVAADMSGYSNGRGINKWHLKLRVKFDDESILETSCSAYPTGPMGGFQVGDVIPVRYLPDDRSKVEVDRDAMVEATQARRREGEAGLLRLGEERLARGGDS